MSARGVAPKISSGSSVVPSSPLSKFLARGGRDQTSGLGRIGVQGALDGVAHQHETAGRAGDSAADHDQAFVGVDGRDFDIERGDALVTHMAGHLLAGKGLAGVLPVAGGAGAAMADRHAVAGFEAGEVPALHGAGETLAFAGAANIDFLTDHEMRRRQSGTLFEHRVGIDAEFHQLGFRLDLAAGEVALVGRAYVLHLGGAVAELHRGVFVAFHGARIHHLHLVEVQHGDGHVGAVFLEHPGHAQLLGDQSSAHDRIFTA
jgi:hypothetical protein